MGKIRGGCGPSMSLRLCLVSIDCGVVVLRCIGALLAGKRDFARAVQSVSAGASGARVVLCVLGRCECEGIEAFAVEG